VLGDGLAVFADQLGEAAEGDQGFGIDPKCGHIDPVRWSKPRLAGQPRVERRLIEQKLSAAAAAPATGRQLTNGVRESWPSAPELPDVVVCPALARRPGSQSGEARR